MKAFMDAWALRMLECCVTFMQKHRKGTQILGRSFGKFLWYAFPKRRRLAMSSIQKHLGVPEAEARRIAYQSFQENGLSFFEITLTGSFSFGSPLLEYENPDRMEALKASPRAVVAPTGHLGSWELLAALLGDLFDASRPRVVVVRKNSNTIIQAFMTKQRSSAGAHVLDHRNAAPAILRALYKQGIVAFLADHNASRHEALFVPFLGEEAAINKGAAILALRAKALVWPIYLIRREGCYVLVQDEPLDTTTLQGTHDEQVRQIVEFYVHSVEKQVKAHPEQWFWMHNRWKTKQFDAPEEENRVE